MTTTDSPVTEPSPAPDMSRATPTTKVHRETFASLSPADKAALRQRVAALVADGSKTGAAWATAFGEWAHQSSEPEPDRDALYQQAVARKKEGKRGKGIRLSDEDFIAYVADIQTRFPDSSSHREREIAYWLMGISLSTSRWATVWAAATERLAS